MGRIGIEACPCARHLSGQRERVAERRSHEPAVPSRAHDRRQAPSERVADEARHMPGSPHDRLPTSGSAKTTACTSCGGANRTHGVVTAAIAGYQVGTEDDARRSGDLSRAGQVKFDLPYPPSANGCLTAAQPRRDVPHKTGERLLRHGGKCGETFRGDP